LSARDKHWFSPDKRPSKKVAKKKPSLGLVGKAFEQANGSVPPRCIESADARAGGHSMA